MSSPFHNHHTLRLEDNTRGYLELISLIPDGREDTECFPSCQLSFQKEIWDHLMWINLFLCFNAELLKVKVQLTATNSSKFESHYCQLCFAGSCQRGILTRKLACWMFHSYTNQIQARCLVQGEKQSASSWCLCRTKDSMR